MGAPARAHELLDELFDVLKSGQDEWVDQKHSPLGRKRHLELARTGKLPSSKDGRRVLIRQSAIDAYLAAKKRVVKITDEQAEERDVENALNLIRGGRR